MEYILILLILVSLICGYTTGVYMSLKKLRNMERFKNIYRSERNELRRYRQNVENILNSKGTIVDKYDKIIEVTTTANVK